MQKINFQNLPNTTTPINDTNLNDLQTNVENAIDDVVVSGSNANGNYVKLTDGTMIEWGTIDKTKFLQTSSAYTASQGINWYRSNLATQTLPIQYIDNNYRLNITIQTGLNGTRMSIPRISNVTASAFEMQLISVDDYLQNSNGYKDIVDVNWVAIGKWK